MGCQTRLTLPPAADLDSLIQSFTSNGDIDDPPIAISNSSLNNSQIRRKLFSDDDDLLDETPPLVQPRRSSSFDVKFHLNTFENRTICSFSFSLDIVRQVQVNNKLEKIFSFNIWNQLHPIVRLYLSKLQPIRRKILDLNYLLKHHNKVTPTSKSQSTFEYVLLPFRSCDNDVCLTSYSLFIFNFIASNEYVYRFAFYSSTSNA